MHQSSFKPKPCKCGWLHSSLSCPDKPRKRLQAKRRIRRTGKLARQYKTLREEVLAEWEPPYLCIYCLVNGYENFLLPEWINVEHGESKARHPDRRFDKSNLFISCGYHNADKGSRDIDEYIAFLLAQTDKRDS